MGAAIEVRAANAAELTDVRTLWREYWTELGMSDEFQGFGRELAGLPGVYIALLVAYVDGEAAGTIALRPLQAFPDGSAGEFKRMYVRPAYRRLGVGRALLAAMFAGARAAGYRAVYADTLRTLTAARAMYRKLGFEEIEPYVAEPDPAVVYFRLDL